MGDESEGNRRPYMRLWIDDVRGSCMDMSAAQFGAHMRMLMHAWERGSVPADERRLRRIVGEVDWADMADVIDRWSRRDDGTLVHARLERERQRMADEHDRKARAGRSGGQARGKQNPSRSQAEHQADGQAETKHSHTPILPDSHTPKHPHSDDVCSDATERARTVDPIRWSVDVGWTGITDKDRSDWAVAYPAVRIDQETAKAHQWLLARPAKQRKKRWRAFLTGWLSRTQESGGSRGGHPPALPVRDESHIPEDVHPDDRRMFWTPDGKPKMPAVWHRKDGTWNID